MIEGSAFHRTPIEIWTMILYHALATPALPFIDGPYGYLGTDILGNMRLFPSKCALYKEFIMMKSTAETFRLVCRTWPHYSQIYGIAAYSPIMIQLVII
jgi:hypothetical protein